MFSFGSSKTSSNSSSLDVGAQVSSSFSDSLASSVSRSGGTSRAGQSVWNADLLQQLYGQALGAAPDASLFTGQAADL
jgi:hypothetical protein